MQLEPITCEQDAIAAIDCIATVFAADEPIGAMGGAGYEFVIKYMRPLSEGLMRCVNLGIKSNFIVKDANGIAVAGFLSFPVEWKTSGVLEGPMFHIDSCIGTSWVRGGPNLAFPNPEDQFLFCLAGVAPTARGRGFQKQAHDLTVSAARKAGYKCMITECSSIGSLISMGVRLPKTASREDVEALILKTAKCNEPGVYVRGMFMYDEHFCTLEQPSRGKFVCMPDTEKFITQGVFLVEEVLEPATAIPKM